MGGRIKVSRYGWIMSFMFPICVTIWLSVRKLTKNDLVVNFENGVATIKKGGKLITINVNSILATNISKVDTIQLCHHRFVHIGQNSLKEMVRQKSIIGLDCSTGSLKLCDYCAEGNCYEANLMGQERKPEVFWNWSILIYVERSIKMIGMVLGSSMISLTSPWFIWRGKCRNCCRVWGNQSYIWKHN